MIRASAVLLLALMLGACRDQPDQVATVDRNNPLDVAASEANLIVDAATSSPVGLYVLSHAAGEDGLCVTAGESGDLSFGLILRFGATLTCEGRGEARHRGSTLTLNFDGAQCSVNAIYDGLSVRLPGTVADGCASVCGPRASISGGSMDRVGWDENDAARLRSARASGERQLCRAKAAP